MKINSQKLYTFHTILKINEKKIVNLEILQCYIGEKMLEDYTTIKSLG